jgi:hypothetical protein
VPRGDETPADLPLLHEIEKTVSLIPEVFTSAESSSIYAPLPLANARKQRHSCRERCLTSNTSNSD